MSVTADIRATWRRPRAVIRRQLDGGRREDRALAYVMGACVLIFVAQLPRLAREAHLDESIPLDVRLQAALLGWLMIAPLVLYGVAALSHVVARALGGKGTWFGARLAMFWSLLSSAPLWLFYGLVDGFIGPGGALVLAGVILLAGFGTIWLLSLVEAEGFGKKKAEDNRAGP